MADGWPRDTDPDTIAAIVSGRAVVHTIDDMLERVDRIRARRPSPSGNVIPEVDGMGRLTDLYIGPGTIAHSGTTQELVADIMAAIQDSTDDALRQHRSEVDRMQLPEVPWPRPGGTPGAAP